MLPPPPALPYLDSMAREQRLCSVRPVIGPLVHTEYTHLQGR
jgi:hypothetical protein